MTRPAVPAVYVATAADDNYAQHCAVALLSLCQNNLHAPLRVFVLTPGLNRLNQDNLRACLAAFANTELSFISVDDRRLGDLDDGFKGRAGKTNYYRLLLPDLLSTLTDKVLYIDSDVVIEDDVVPLWKTDIARYSFAAAENPWHRAAKRHEGTGLPPHAPYFNSGVMLLNLRRLAGNDLVRSLAETKSNPHLDLMPGSDMDPLNALFKDDWLKIDPRWNVIGTHYFLARFFGASDMSGADYVFTDSPQAIRAAVASPRIVHYAGSPKPWESASTHPRKNLYWHYLSQTPWRGAHRLHGPRRVFLREHMTKWLLPIGRLLPLQLKNWLVQKAYRPPWAR